MKLINLIHQLENQPQDNVIHFDFCRAVPCSIDSSRKSYNELAIGFEFTGNMKVNELLVICKGALGTTYLGYKGGEFLMGEYTKVWVDNYGQWTNTKITAVLDHGFGHSMITTMNNEV